MNAVQMKFVIGSRTRNCEGSSMSSSKVKLSSQYERTNKSATKCYRKKKHEHS